MSELTQLELKRVLAYCQETGVFTWAVGRGNQFARAGATAGYLNSDGYRKIEISGKAYGAHRLAWFYMKGEWPVPQVDHRNGVRDDNRWDNLRQATRQINMQNRRKAQPYNTTGYLGVRKNCKGFLASISVSGKRRNLGTYSTPQEAHAVYLKAKRELHPGNML